MNHLIWYCFRDIKLIIGHDYLFNGFLDLN